MASCSLIPPVKTGSGLSLCHGLMRYGAQNPPMTCTYSQSPSFSGCWQTADQNMWMRRYILPKQHETRSSDVYLRSDTKNIHFFLLPLLFSRSAENADMKFPASVFLYRDYYLIYNVKKILFGAVCIDHCFLADTARTVCRKIATVRLIIP